MAIPYRDQASLVKHGLFTPGRLFSLAVNEYSLYRHGGAGDLVRITEFVCR